MVEVLNSEVEIEKEESAMTKMLKALKIDDDKDIMILIVKTKMSDKVVCGKPIIDYVRLAAENYDCIEVEEMDPLNLAKNYAKPGKSVVIIYGDTPLLKGGTLKDIIDFFKMKELEVMQLVRGWVFGAKYLATTHKMIAPQLYYFGENDFLEVNSAENLANAGKEMRKRINNYFFDIGVTFENISSVYIEADVEIEENVHIGAGVSIKGNSVIKKGAEIKNNAVIEDSVIFEDAVVDGARVYNSIVMQRVNVEPFSVIKNNSVVKEGENVKSFSVIVGEE